MTRLSPVDPATFTAAQQEIFDRMTSGPRGALTGPFPIVLRSPELTTRIEKFGDYVRFECGLSERVKKVAILVVARNWRSDFEWAMHAPGAAKLGISAAAIEAIGLGERPAFDDEADAAVYAYSHELISTGHVSKPAFDRALKLLGEMGVVDLPTLIGFYSFLAMLMNSLEVPAGAGAVLPWSRG